MNAGPFRKLNNLDVINVKKNIVNKSPNNRKVNNSNSKEKKNQMHSKIFTKKNERNEFFKNVSQKSEYKINPVLTNEINSNNSPFTKSNIKIDEDRHKILEEQILLLKQELIEKDKLLVEKDLKISQMENEIKVLNNKIENINKDLDSSKTIEYNDNRSESYTINLEEINEEKNVVEIKSMPVMESINQEQIIFQENNYNNYIFSSHRSYQFDEINPNIDIMTYEQIIELQERIGYVSKGFDDDEIKNFPISKYDKGEYNDEQKCSICLTEYIQLDEIRKMNCNHIFHKSCLDNWLRMDKSCPNCKKDILFI